MYRVGHRAPSVEARYMAAVQACGNGAVLSGLAAAHLLGLINRPPSLPEVTTLTERRVNGIETRRTRNLDRRDITTFKRIPVTTVARTLVDIAAHLDEDDLARACHEAGVKYKTTPRQVEAVLKRRPNAPGAPAANAVDCRWPAHTLTVELDSYRFHNSRHASEQDRRRRATSPVPRLA